MKKLFYIAFALMLFGCNRSDKKVFNERISFWKKDKIPYGCYIAFENLKYIFPEASSTINNTEPFISYRDSLEAAKGKALYVIIGGHVDPSAKATVALLNKAWQGDHVFISAAYIGKELLDSLKVAVSAIEAEFAEDTIRSTIVDPSNNDRFSYTYPGLITDSYFTKLDTNFTQVLGKNSRGKANCIRFNYESGGSFTLHLSPFSFTNFFLLHKNNIAYYNRIFSLFPQDIKLVEWDDYFHNINASEGDGFSAFSFLFKQKAFQWAILLAVILCVILFLVESKRRQREIPESLPLRNSSVDFVNTIGRLYFQQKDHRNLALKMIAYFLDHVRSKYNISTSALDSDFVGKLSYKAGFDKEELEMLLADIAAIETRDAISEEELLLFSKRIEKFK